MVGSSTQFPVRANSLTPLVSSELDIHTVTIQPEFLASKDEAVRVLLAQAKTHQINTISFFRRSRSSASYTVQKIVKVRIPLFRLLPTGH